MAQSMEVHILDGLRGHRDLSTGPISLLSTLRPQLEYTVVDIESTVGVNVKSVLCVFD